MLICTIWLFRLYGVLVLVFATFLETRSLHVSPRTIYIYTFLTWNSHNSTCLCLQSTVKKGGVTITPSGTMPLKVRCTLCSRSFLLSGDWSTYFQCVHSDTYIQQWTTYDLFQKYFMHSKTIFSVLGWIVVWLREASILIWAGASGPVASVHA